MLMMWMICIGVGAEHLVRDDKSINDLQDDESASA